jgi:hypothetical protein
MVKGSFGNQYMYTLLRRDSNDMGLLFCFASKEATFCIILGTQYFELFACNNF